MKNKEKLRNTGWRRHYGQTQHGIQEQNTGTGKMSLKQKLVSSGLGLV